MPILQRLEGLDLSTIHTVLCLIGALLAVYQMQLISHKHEDLVDPIWLRWGRRFALLAVALSLTLLVLYADARQWQPWPPQIGLVLAVIMTLGVRILAIHARIRRDRNLTQRFSKTTVAAHGNVRRSF